MTKQRSAIKGDRALWQSVFGVQLILGLILGNLYLLSHNTLHNNGRWRSPEYEAAMHLMASEAYYLRPQALASNRLNLAAWHGFNEVMYHEPVELQSIKADVDLGPNAYVSVIFNATETGSAGVRLSNNPHSSSMLFTCAPDGTFVKKTRAGSAQNTGRPTRRTDRIDVGECRHYRIERRGVGQVSFGC